MSVRLVIYIIYNCRADLNLVNYLQTSTTQYYDGDVLCPPCKVSGESAEHSLCLDIEHLYPHLSLVIVECWLCGFIEKVVEMSSISDIKNVIFIA